MTYVNQEAFFAWYNSVSRRPLRDGDALLGEVFSQYCSTGRQEYTLPASATVSGKEESFPFRYENVGCCGASTMFIYF
jgi:hypothetical protein